MHAPSLHKWHIFDRSLTFLEHHQKFTLVLLMFIFIGAMYGVAVQLEAIRILRIGGNTEISGGEFSEMVRPLTRLMDQDYAHEYLVREQYLLDHLEHFRDVTLAERVYVVLYNDAFSRVSRGSGQHISNSLEVTREGIPPKIISFQGLSRHVWLQLKQDEQSKNELSVHFPKRYGRELYDAHNVAIGYLGIEKQQEEAMLPDQDIQRLRQTAGAITNGLVRPIEELE